MFLLIFWINLVAGSASEYHLSPEARVVYTCEAKNEVAGLYLEPSGVPCSSLYTPMLDKTGYGDTINATTIFDINKLQRITGTRCFKLRLKSTCIQHWFSPNEFSNTYDVQSVSRAECLTTSGCVNCEIALQYPASDCKVWTWGDSTISKVVLFQFPESVYVNQIGKAFYQEMSGDDESFYLGGTFQQYLFFSKPTQYETKIVSYNYNPKSGQLISLDDKMLLTPSGGSVIFDGKNWTVYDNNHLVLVNIVASTNLSSGNSAQSYYEYFTKAQIAVMQWNLNYLSCRLKNLALSIHKNGRDSAAILDLDVGEVFESGYLKKYKCSSVGVGSISNRGGCLSFNHLSDEYSVGPSGLLVELGKACVKSLRVNSSHVLNINSYDGVSLDEYSFNSLEEEEGVLKSIPDVTVNINEIRDMIKNFGTIAATIIPNISTSSNVATTTVTLGSSNIWTYLLYLCVGVVVLCVVVAVIYICLPYIRSIRNQNDLTGGKDLVVIN